MVYTYPMELFRRLFHGRINRSNYALGTLVNFIWIISYMLTPLPAFVTKYTPKTIPSAGYLLGFFVFIFFDYALTARRMHDVNASYAMRWKCYSSELGFFPTISVFFKKGTNKTNQWGKPPKPRSFMRDLLGF